MEAFMFMTLIMALLGGKLLFGEKGCGYGLAVWVAFWTLFWAVCLYQKLFG